MEQLILASYVFKANQRARDSIPPDDAPETVPTSARRSMMPVAASFAGIAAFALVLSFL